MRSALLLAVVLLTGCATNQHDAAAARAYYKAQQEAQKPLVKLESRQGEDIVLEGVKTFAVYPRSGGDINQRQEQYHPAWQIAGNALNTALPIFATGWSAVQIADEVGSAVNDAADEAGDDVRISNSQNTDSSDNSVDRSDRSVDNSVTNSGRMNSDDQIDRSDRSVDESVTNSGRQNSDDQIDRSVDESITNSGRQNSDDRIDNNNTESPANGEGIQ